MLSWIFFLLDISGWKEDDKFFLETHNFQGMFKKVKNQPYVMFIGVPGSGKTATARHIALKLQEEDGYDILSIKDLKDIDTYCVQDKKQVFVIDDVLGIFGFAMDLLTLLYKFRDTLNNLTMSKTKVIMTCREEVYRNKHIALLSDNFLQNHDNLVLLHTEENALNDQDKRGLLKKYEIDVNALSQVDLTATSNMFPFLCKLYKEFSNFDPTFFILPVSIIMKRLNEMENMDPVQYASLVLLMANHNRISKTILDENSEASFREKKDNFLKKCQIRSTTESFEFLHALKRAELSYTNSCGDEFTFIHDSMFEIVAYHFGKRNSELLLEYMSSDFIANNITVNKAYPSKNESEELSTDEEYRIQPTEHGNASNLSIELEECHYPHLAKRLYTDIHRGELNNVFENEALKHPEVLQFFIEELEKKQYEEIYTVFLSKKRIPFESNKKKNDEKEKKKSTWYMASDINLFNYKGIFESSVRTIKWVIYYGHYHILRCIIDMILKHNGNTDDLFLNVIKTRRYHSAIETRKSKKRSYIKDKINKGEYLLCLGCFSGDPDTVQILLNEVHDDVRNNLYEPLVIASYNGHASIVKELIKAKANVNASYKGEVTPLIAACYGGHIDVVTMLILAGADVNQAEYNEHSQYPHGPESDVNYCQSETPITAACKTGASGIVELLIEKGADVNVKNEDIGTPLTVACEMGHFRVVEVLLKNEADVSLEDGYETVPLTAAYENNHFDIVELLIKNGCENQNKTLSAACFEGDISAVKKFLKAGANVNLKDGVITPIKAACIAGHSDIVKLLINVGADVNLRDGDQLPLTTACKRGHLSVVKELIKARVNINVCYRYKTPLTSACETNSVCLVKELIKAGANVNQDAPLLITCGNGNIELTKELIKAGSNVNQIYYNQSPLGNACSNKHFELVKVLIESGADVNLGSSLSDACIPNNLQIVQYLLKAGAKTDLKGALVCTCFVEYSEQQLNIVQELIKAGADVNWEDEDFGSSLQHASACGNLSIVKELLKAGADINLGKFHEPPLIGACAEGHLDVVKELVKTGADVNIHGCLTPLTAACSFGHLNIVEELLLANADVNLGDINYTPLYTATKNGSLNIMELLIKTGAKANLIYNQSIPLIAACRMENLAAVQMLIKAGADVNLTAGKESSLKTAYKCCDQDVIYELLEAGADTRISGCCQCIS